MIEIRQPILDRQLEILWLHRVHISKLSVIWNCCRLFNRAMLRAGYAAQLFRNIKAISFRLEDLLFKASEEFEYLKIITAKHC